MNLMPAAIDRACRAEDVERLKELRVNLCIECGCCAYVCPAKRHLVIRNRLGKKLVREATPKNGVAWIHPETALQSSIIAQSGRRPGAFWMLNYK
jgi:Na+-translocating ferredoxin:NAD+ oxidoreductase RnfC subunit